MYTEQDLADLNSIRYTPHTIDVIASIRLHRDRRILIEVIELPRKTITRYYPQRWLEAQYGLVMDNPDGICRQGIRRPADWFHFYDKQTPIRFETIEQAVWWLTEK